MKMFRDAEKSYLGSSCFRPSSQDRKRAQWLSFWQTGRRTLETRQPQSAGWPGVLSTFRFPEALLLRNVALL